MKRLSGFAQAFVPVLAVQRPRQSGSLYSYRFGRCLGGKYSYLDGARHHWWPLVVKRNGYGHLKALNSTLRFEPRETRQRSSVPMSAVDFLWAEAGMPVCLNYVPNPTRPWRVLSKVMSWRAVQLTGREPSILLSCQGRKTKPNSISRLVLIRQSRHRWGVRFLQTSASPFVPSTGSHHEFSRLQRVEILESC
jgi:hypothetical protein